MPNTLQVEGRKTAIIDPNTNLDIILNATYQSARYELQKVTGGQTEKHAALIFHLVREGGPVEGGLNTILLMTNGQGKYKATGISGYAFDGKPQWYMMGDDLQISIPSAAEEAIRSLRR